MNLRRYVCPWCGRSVPVRHCGALFRHGRGVYRGYPNGEGMKRVGTALCVGSGWMMEEWGWVAPWLTSEAVG